VTERALRELYLLPFEAAVTDARAWLVMSAYNGVNGATMSENDLLDSPLKQEWGFDGVVVSDWSAVRTLESARHAQDLVMPGPNGPWGEALVAAVRSGDIPESVVDDKVRRILLLAERVGAIAGAGTAPIRVSEDGIGFAREVACEGMVLLENRHELPWGADALASLAVIGDNARHAQTQGGGSASVVPERVISPLAGLQDALPDAEISYSLGAVVQHTVAELPLEEISNPATGEAGVRVRLVDREGATIFTDDRRATSLVWSGGDAPIENAVEFQFDTRWTPSTTGAIRIGFAAVGTGRVFINGRKVVEQTLQPMGWDILASRLPRDTATALIETTAGQTLDLRFEFDMLTRSGAMHLLLVRVGTEPAVTDADVLIAEAVAAARRADAALVVVGTNQHVESEGFDRESLALPGRQDELVAAVAAANPRTVVVVNAGAPVLMPWRNDVAAVLLGWFGGQEFGAAVASVLLGEAEPGGRLTTTWPEHEQDVPVLSTTPVDGVLEYSEGIHVGYRAWLRSGAEPAYWFGAGRGYTEFALRAVDVTPNVRAGETVTVTVDIENLGARAGKEVIQIYVEREESTVERPNRWLVGFAAVRLAAGERSAVAVDVSTRLLAYWDEGWRYETGKYLLKVGTSAAELPLRAEVTLLH
jgi:beta-glucosidase